MSTPKDGRAQECWGIRQLEEEIRQCEKKLLEDRGSDPDDEHLSAPQAGLLVAVGALGIAGTGHVASLEFQLLLGAEKVRLMDPGVGVGQAAQRGLQSLGSWAPLTAFGLGALLFLVLALRPSLRSGERPRNPGGDWRAWALALGLLAIPFFDFTTAGETMGLPIGIGVACGLYGIVLGLGKSDTLREVFGHFRNRWFGILFVLIVALMFGGFLAASPAVVLPGVLVASCFSLHLMSIGFEKRAKVRSWQQQESRIGQMRIELDRLRKEFWIERELRHLLADESAEDEEEP